ncbi:acetylornithine deacetylase [Allocatelliglobosispora scoriae]|uniref:Probable succinyl-diaminopimelate desuccinylase n=1 Tax=Allocatelliglobosispora scoriae TaxID=643052 RepID=A0A841BER9_9ACTN|nr:ArgE/DapE family deacylase [Allocatelliglobosispora scoriae]MBB5867577.1 acetylornithine deacetylase [Allocatelliglobosispora scoriae]
MTVIQAADLLRELVRIPSVGGTPDEAGIQAYLADLLRDSGLEVDHWRLPLAELTAEPDFPGMEAERTESWGLVARLPGTGGGRSIMFNGHVDVVPPGDLDAWHGDPYSGALHGDLLFGRGACDMKGGLVSALLAVLELRKARPRGDVLIACVVGEEDGGLGTYGLLRRGWRADACVIPEPTGLAVVPANAGALTFRLRVPGLAAHAARRGSGVSAIEKFLPVFAALRELEARRCAEVDPLMRRWDIAYPIEIGMVRAGDWASSVPGELVAEGRLGVALDESPAAAQAALEAAVATACAADPWLADHPITVEWWGGQFVPARNGDAELVQRLVRATGGQPELWGAPYGSDLRLLAAAGIPTVQYGPGDIDLAHAPNEHVRISEVVTATATLVRLAADHCG